MPRSRLEVLGLPLPAVPTSRSAFEHSFTCPECGSHHFGTSTLGKETEGWTVSCHGDGCSWLGSYDDHVGNRLLNDE